MPFGIVVNRDGERFYDEGEDFWPKRYAIWGRLVAQQPDQIAYSIIDAKAIGTFMPSVFPPIEADTHRASSRGSSGSTRDALERDGRPSSTRPCARAPSTTTMLDDCRTEGLDAAEDALGAAASTRRRSTATRCGPASRSPTSASTVDERARVLMDDGAPSPNMFAAGEIMAGNILGKGYLAGFGMTIGTRVRADRRARRRARACQRD